MARRRMVVVKIARNSLSAGITTRTQRSGTRTRGHSTRHTGMPNSFVSFRVYPWLQNPGARQGSHGITQKSTETDAGLELPLAWLRSFNAFPN